MQKDAIDLFFEQEKLKIKENTFKKKKDKQDP
jgi:hypothetical protein